MDREVTSRAYEIVDVPVRGGSLRVGVWESAPGAPTVLLVHGITSSHLAWSFVAERLPGVRLIAPDLRGRGGSEALPGPTGLQSHAADLDAVLTHFRVDRALVVGHSMGAFVSVVFAHLYPARVSRLVLVDGGLPLDVPTGLGADALLAHVLGPTAERLAMRFPSTDAYLDFWREHPAFTDAWSPEVRRYFAYDLIDDGAGALRAASRYDLVVQDNADQITGGSLREALADLGHPTRLVTAPRGLRNETPGLYEPVYLDRMLRDTPSIRHERSDALNHYTIVLSPEGAEMVAEIVSEELAAA